MQHYLRAKTHRASGKVAQNLIQNAQPNSSKPRKIPESLQTVWRGPKYVPKSQHPFAKWHNLKVGCSVCKTAKAWRKCATTSQIALWERHHYYHQQQRGTNLTGGGFAKGWRSQHSRAVRGRASRRVQIHDLLQVALVSWECVQFYAYGEEKIAKSNGTLVLKILFNRSKNNVFFYNLKLHPFGKLPTLKVPKKSSHSRTRIFPASTFQNIPRWRGQVGKFASPSTPLP